MSVRITDTSTALWQFAHDESDHTGEADPSTLSYMRNPDGSLNREMVVVPCPVADCDSVSYWPRESLPPDVQAKLP